MYSGRSLTSGSRSASVRPWAMRAWKASGSCRARRPSRVPARSAAMSRKLKPLPWRASATSLYRPIASASGPPPSAASAAEISRCCGKSIRPCSSSSAPRLRGRATGLAASPSQGCRRWPLTRNASATSAARFSCAALAASGLWRAASWNIDASRGVTGKPWRDGAWVACAASWLARWSAWRRRRAWVSGASSVAVSACAALSGHA